MRVLFDSSVTDFDRGGTDRYVRSLLPELGRIDGLDLTEVRMQTSWPWSARLPRAARVVLHDFAWVPWGAVGVGRRLQATLYHGAGFKVPPRAGFATSVTIHDDTPWDQPPTARLYNRVYMRRLLQVAAPRVAGAITSAEATARAIIARLPALGGRLHVTPWGVDHGTFRPRATAEVEAAQRQVGVKPPYAILVSPYGPRKNEAAMLTALAGARASHPGLQALIIGRHGEIANDPLPVVRAGRVEDDSLAALYSGAAFLFYASLKEGFGLPVLEAMSCRCPVIATGSALLDEVTAGTAVSTDPASASSMVTACELLLTDEPRRQQLAAAGEQRAAGFTWERTARLTAAAWVKMT